MSKRFTSQAKLTEKFRAKQEPLRQETFIPWLVGDLPGVMALSMRFDNPLLSPRDHVLEDVAVPETQIAEALLGQLLLNQQGFGMADEGECPGVRLARVGRAISAGRTGPGSVARRSPVGRSR
ncbi:hypothetical protein ABT173_05715 [Streptomyces sp. NPDC001795]|uniref:hypothetical protein n=1 Tax=Streptomyces sp. NPDC001795 TaxID=3154525 RepID=UPI00331CD4E3